MRLTENFTLDEMTSSQTAERMGFDNTPDDEVLANLKITARMLEQVRKLLGHPIHVSSGYRSPMVNRAVGGSANSQHTKGYAVDFTCPAFGTPRQIVDAIRKSPIHYDQLILEFDRWVHISFTPTPRLQALIIDKAGTRVFA